MDELRTASREPAGWTLGKVAALCLTVAVVSALAVGLPSLGFYADLQRSHDSLKLGYTTDKNETLGRNLDLLNAMMAKLAEISEDKEAQTGLAAFGVMKAAFRLLADASTISDQHETLCLNSTVSNAFTVSIQVGANHTSSCARYDALVPLVDRLRSGAIEMNEFQGGFNELVMALVELDNAISSDP